MAKYNVKFACGHEEMKELFGPMKDRESKIAYWGKVGICSKCYQEKIQNEMTKEFEEVVVKYYDYKNNPEYANCKTKANSYNAADKTIVVYVKKEEIVKEEKAKEEELFTKFFEMRNNKDNFTGNQKVELVEEIEKFPKVKERIHNELKK